MIVLGKNKSGDAFLDARVKSGRTPNRVEFRSHIFEGYADGRFGVCLMLATKARWTNARKRLEAAGFIIRQDGDTEGIATFDPTNGKQARLALKVTGARIKRAVTPEQRAAMTERLRLAREAQKMPKAA